MRSVRVGLRRCTASRAMMATSTAPPTGGRRPDYGSSDSGYDASLVRRVAIGGVDACWNDGADRAERGIGVGRASDEPHAELHDAWQRQVAIYPSDTEASG